MEKSNLKLNYAIKSLSSLLFLFLLVGNSSIYAQCALGVNLETQVSLDQDCQAEITPEMVLNDQSTSCPGGIFSAVVTDLNEVPIPSSPIVTSDYIDQTLIVEITDEVSGNTAWGYLIIEDKLAPVFDCVDVTVGCSDVASFVPNVSDGCDPNPTVMLLSQSEVVLNCDPDYIKEITRVYQATDASGNVSATCSQVITVERVDFTTLAFPDDLAQGGGNPIQCDESYPVDSEGNPDPSFTGVPTINGASIFPNTDLSCNTVVSYNDLVLPTIEGVQKIMREWIVNEWFCNTSNMVTYIQIIEIVDDEGPVVSDCPDDYTVSTSAGTNCEAIIILPSLTATDACGTVSAVDVVYPGGFLNNSNGGLVALPLGVNAVTYTLYDNHNNTSTCTFNVTVEDNTPPVVVCDQNTVVSLSIDGTAIVNAFSFDDGSYDDCTDVEFSVRRMDNGGSCDFDDTFSPTVTFCCADIGSDVMVILRVVDEYGNLNECMVNVEVQDKLPPAITCPPNLTVDCGTPFDPEDLAIDFGSADAADNCSFTMTETSSINLDQCGVGTIVRIFTATDPNGSVQCTQIITFVNNEPFVESDITWPSDVTINDCVDPSTLHPDQTGYPAFTEDACDAVGFDWDDKTFTVVNGDNACFKIIRTWEVLDWCQNNNGNYQTWTYQQTIKVINTDDPVFTGTYEDLMECTFDEECLDGFIALGAEAGDACTDELIWSYQIDAFNDGSFDIISDVSIGESVDASGTYPIGNHRIVYIAEDGCGNQVSQTQLFSIVNCLTPTPFCLDGLAIELMPVDTDDDGEADFGMVDVLASDFDAGSFHQCGLPVTVSFSAEPLDTSRTYTCDDLGENTVEIWAHAFLPNGDILQDFCIASLDIQANNGICDGATSSTVVVIEGDIENEMSEKASDVNLSLIGSEFVTTTNTDGAYSFPAMPIGGAYELIPNKPEDDHLNGITTLDIIVIQKHILGLEILDSPYKVIAADVNNDEKVSGADIIGLRKLILGVYEQFPANDDWRFVDKAYTFLNSENPLNEDFTETYEIQSLNADMEIDFVSIKVGDVNSTAKVNFDSQNADTRSAEVFTMSANDKAFEVNEEVVLELTASEATELYGMQYTMKFNDMYLAFDRIESTRFDMTPNVNFGLNRIDQGIVSVSVSDSRLMDIDSDEVLFNVYFTANRAGQLSGNVTLNSDVTSAEAYDENLEVMDMSIEFRNNEGEEVTSSPFVLYQNVPNPFGVTTNISFNLPKSTTVNFSVFDVAGKLVYNTTGLYSKGMNSIELNVADLATSGVLYYQIETKEQTATRKMVVLK